MCHMFIIFNLKSKFIKRLYILFSYKLDCETTKILCLISYIILEHMHTTFRIRSYEKFRKRAQ